MLLRYVSQPQMHSPMHDDMIEQACRRSRAVSQCQMHSSLHVTYLSNLAGEVITDHTEDWWYATCFGGSVCSVLGCRHAISSSTIHVEDVAAGGLLLHHLHGCPCAQQGAHHVGAHHLLQLLWRGVNEGLQQQLDC